MIHVPRNAVTPDEPGNYFAEASALGWAPGFFPIELLFCGRLIMRRMSLTDDGAIYGTFGNLPRDFNLIVWND